MCAKAPASLCLNAAVLEAKGEMSRAKDVYNKAVCACLHTRTLNFVHAHMHACVRAFVRARMLACTHACVHMCVSMRACVCGCAHTDMVCTGCFQSAPQGAGDTVGVGKHAYAYACAYACV